MVSHKYENVMRKAEQIEAYNLFLRDWTIPEIAVEVKKTTGTIRNWHNRYGWRERKMFDLRDIEEEMREQTQKARKQILDIGTQALDDIFVRNDAGDVVGIKLCVEDIKDLKIISETILKTGGVPEKIETVNETTLTGDVSVKTEVVDPEMAAMVGRAIALKQSRGEDV